MQSGGRKGLRDMREGEGSQWDEGVQKGRRGMSSDQHAKEKQRACGRGNRRAKKKRIIHIRTTHTLCPVPVGGDEQEGECALSDCVSLDSWQRRSLRHLGDAAFTRNGD